VFIGTGDRDAPGIINTLALPKCWECKVASTDYLVGVLEKASASLLRSIENRTRIPGAEQD